MKRDPIIAWLPIAIMPAGVMLLTPEDWPRWVFMWLLAWTIFAGCKWLTWQTSVPSDATPGRQIGYLAGWPGLDAPAFLGPRSLCVPPLTDWLFALVKLGLGIVLIVGVYPRVSAECELARRGGAGSATARAVRQKLMAWGWSCVRSAQLRLQLTDRPTQIMGR